MVLFVGDVLQPVDGFAFEGFLDGDRRHCRGGGGAVPVLFAGRKPHDIAGTDFLDGSSRAKANWSPGDMLPDAMRGKAPSQSVRDGPAARSVRLKWPTEYTEYTEDTEWKTVVLMWVGLYARQR